MTTTIGILHPGQMGSSVGAAARSAGARAICCSEGRSAATRERAARDGLADVRQLAELVAQSQLIVSVCPPHAAEQVADAVARLGFTGLYLDANAIAPHTMRRIAERLQAAGASVVDGGIVGPPARKRGATILYLSGERAAEVAALFGESALQTHVLGAEPGEASAVKMAFAAWTKGSSALLLAVRALAHAQGAEAGLLHAWSRFAPELAARAQATAANTAPKAWRFVGEMEEIAATFEAAGLPPGFHQAAAEVYARLAEFKDHPTQADGAAAPSKRASARPRAPAARQPSRVANR
jgi:3-hydroxyisobutyrate dehydrogenase-like beta-hydroxyacid dehydrogenase